MYLTSVHIQNFRGIEDLALELRPGCNVLAGVNGVGKTAVLDAIAMLMGGIVCSFQPDFKAPYPVFEDVKNDANTASLKGELSHQGKCYPWEVAAERVASSWKTKKLKVEQGLPFFPNLTGQQMPPTLAMPVLVAYSVRRGVVAIPERIRLSRAKADRVDAGYQIQEDGTTDFRQFFAWFREREDAENEHRVNKDSGYRDPALEAVRVAVGRFTGFQKLRIRRQTPMRMTVEKLGEELSINQLSDGEKTTLAMVGDIARRLSILNPERPVEAVMNGTGVVLIDEIELHLHPQWQREILPKLAETFPNCQFIVTTHSPQVLSHVEAERIWLLQRGEDGKITAENPERSFGLDSNRVLVELLGVPERPQEAKDRISKVFGLVEAGDFVKAKAEIESAKSLIGDLRELDAALALMRRKERLGR